MIGSSTKNKLNTNSSVTTTTTTLADTIKATKIQKNVNNNNIVEELERKINTITISLKPHISTKLHDLIKTNIVNAKIIYEYIISEQNELNIKDSTK